MTRAGRVVAAVDGSEVSRAVLRSAAVLAARVGCGVTVVHVGVPDEALQGLVQQQDLTLDVREGPVVAALLHELDRDDVVMGVLGTRALTPGPLPAGSTALAVLRKATTPVLLVPPAEPTQGLARLARVAMPLDGTEEVSAALEGVLAQLRRGSTDVLVVHVFERSSAPAFWDRPAHDARLWASEFLARHCGEPTARAVLRTGDPGALALDECRAGRADMVLMAWRQDDAAGRALTLKHVLSGATMPVLVVPLRGRP